MMLLRKRLLQLIGSLLALVVLAGCGSYQLKMTDAVAAVGNGGDVATALANVQAINASKTDSVHKQLNEAMLYHLLGKYRDSISTLAAAKREIERLDGISISENIAALTINDTFRSYTPLSAERLLIYELQILNYLALGDLDGARVEVLQAGELLQTYAENSAAKSRLVSLYYLCALVYELNHEYSDALISYRHAYSLYPQGASIPAALSDALITMTKAVGLDEEYAKYIDQFKPTASHLAKLFASDYATWVGMYFQGMVAPLYDSKVAIYVPELEHSVTLSQAAQGQTNYGRTPALYLNNMPITWQVLDDFQAKATQDLNRANAKTTVRMLARAVSKHQMSVAARKEAGNNAVAIFDIVNLFIEVADTRSFNSAPASILINRSRVPAAAYKLAGVEPPLQFTLGGKQIGFYMQSQFAKHGLLYINR